MYKEQVIQPLSYEEFIGAITEAVKNIFLKGYKVSVNPITKNNSIHLDGLVILKEGETTSPSIYLNDYYEEYKEGKLLSEIVKEIKELYDESYNSEEFRSTAFEDNFENLKSTVIFRLINLEKNKQQLQDMPHLPLLDLAIAFYCLIRSSEEGIGTVKITNQLMKLWNTDLNELTELAKVNTPRLFSPVIRPMNDIIREILLDGERNIFKKDIDKQIKSGKIKSRMYILSNEKGINGASSLLYTDILKEFSYQLDTDFYILPSSIHELILVPKDGYMKKEELRKMVKEVNETQVPYEDILSDSVYVYSRELDSISL